MTPDFNKGWQRTARRSLFLDLKRGGYFNALEKESHRQKKNWLGYMTDYVDASGFALGREMDFFGVGVAVKYWGVKPTPDDVDEDAGDFECVAVLFDGHWHGFPRRTHGIIIGYVFNKSGQPVGVELVIYKEGDDRFERDYFKQINIVRC